MMENILVTYSSRSGSTAGVAEAIGDALTAHGFTVDVLPMKDVHDLTPYQAVVAGSAIRREHWLPEAMAFIERHQTDLSHKPFAAFLVCMAMANDTPRTRKSVASWLQPVRDRVAPVSEGLFAGVLDISKIPELAFRIAFRVVVGLGFFKEGDYRDWDAIRTWAEHLPEKLFQEKVAQ